MKDFDESGINNHRFVVCTELFNIYTLILLCTPTQICITIKEFILLIYVNVLIPVPSATFVRNFKGD